MTNLELVNTYVFDIFRKDELDNIKKKLKDDLGITDYNPSSDNHSLDSDDRDTKGNKYNWHIRDINTLLELCVQDSAHYSGFGASIDQIAKLVKNVNISLIDYERLPYCILIISIEFYNNKSDSSKIFTEVRPIIAAFRSYVDRFGGVQSKRLYAGAHSAFLLYLGFNGTEKELKEYFDLCDKLSEAYKITDITNRNKKVLEISVEIKKLTPFNDLPSTFTPLTVLESSPDSTSFIGHLESQGFGGMYTPIIVKFTDTTDWFDMPIEISYRFSKALAFFWQPGLDSSAIISMLTITMWLQFLINTVRNDPRFSDMQSKIENSLNLKDSKNLREYLRQLNKDGSSVVDLSVNLQDFRTFVEPLMQELSDRKNFNELPVMFLSTNRQGINDTPIDKSFLETIKLTMRNGFDELTSILDLKMSQYEKFNAHITNIFNIDLQDKITFYTKISTFAGVTAVAAAIISIIISLLNHHS